MLAVWKERTGGQLPAKPLHDARSCFPDFSAPRVIEELSSFDVAVNGGILEILKSRSIDAPRLGVVNVHPGILPKYRGCTADHIMALRQARSGKVDALD